LLRSIAIATELNGQLIEQLWTITNTREWREVSWFANPTSRIECPQDGGEMNDDMSWHNRS